MIHVIPDEVVFGIDQNGASIKYENVRTISNNEELIKLLKLRLKVYFIDQTQCLQDHGSAFPLTVMTCIGIETLGQILFVEKKEDQSHQFVETIRKVHQTFGRKPSMKFEKSAKAVWPDKKIENIETYGKFLYIFYRNTMIHGYQGKGVFLSYEDTETLDIKDEAGYIILNPDWFWNCFKSYYEKIFAELELPSTKNKQKEQCMIYIQKLLQ